MTDDEIGRIYIAGYGRVNKFRYIVYGVYKLESEAKIALENLASQIKGLRCEELK